MSKAPPAPPGQPAPPAQPAQPAPRVQRAPPAPRAQPVLMEQSAPRAQPVLMVQLAQLAQPAQPAPRAQRAAVVLAAMERRQWPATGPGSPGSVERLPQIIHGGLSAGLKNWAYWLQWQIAVAAIG